MADRNSIVEKIRALLSKTVENGCTEAEMLAALDRAAAMRDAYDIGDEELQLTREEKVVLHADPEDATDPHLLKWRLSYGVRMFCNVEVYRQSGERGYNSSDHRATWSLRDGCSIHSRTLYSTHYTNTLSDAWRQKTSAALSLGRLWCPAALALMSD
jgi:hypothetical protein